MITTQSTYIRNETQLEKLMRSYWFWGIFTITMFFIPIINSLRKTLPPPTPVIGKVPSYELTNEFGKPFGSKNLKGRVYLASFAFTSCPTTCLGLMKNLQIVQKRIRGLGQKVAIITFSVDPENDTPKILFKYARQYQANPHIWNFVTGTHKKMKNLLVKGFRVPMGELEEVEKKVEDQAITMFDIAHTNKLVLVDGNGGIRGYYSTDKEGINLLMIDLGLLVSREIAI